MATKTLQDALEERWETVTTGIGQEFPIEDGPLTGNFLGTVNKSMHDNQTGGLRDQAVHQFAPKDDPEAIVFLWGSYELDTALSKVEQGSLCRVTFTGRSNFNSPTGPRQIRNYKVQVSK